jgi:apolipoprotein N-acyltransferase
VVALSIKQQLTRKRLLGNVLAVLLGGALPLSFAPFNFWPLSFLCLALLIPLLKDLSLAQTLVRAWLFGVGFYGVGVSWVYISIHVYGHTAVWLALLMTGFFIAGLALFTLLQGVSHYYLCRRQPPWLLLLTFPANWVLFEWLRSWLLTGFPWLYVGTLVTDTPFAGLAPVVGVYGVSFWLVLISTLGYLAVVYRGSGRFYSLAGIGLLLVLGWGSGWLNWVMPSAQPPVKVSLIQGNVSQDVKWLPQQERVSLDTYRQLTEQHWHSRIIVWPEGALPYWYVKSPGYDNPAVAQVADLARQAKAHHTTIITGVPVWQASATNEQGNSYNGLWAFGSGHGSYDKQKLVPFGEYVPFAHYLRGLINFFDLPMSNFSVGAAHQPGLLAGNLKVAPLICYESAYPDFAAQQIANKDLIVSVSDDSWFGHSLGPYQHLQIAQMRSLENGRYQLRATNTGISAIINQKGQIVAQAQQFARQVLTGEAYIYQGETPFTRFGSWPILSLVALLLVIAKAYSWCRRRRK